MKIVICGFILHQSVMTMYSGNIGEDLSSKEDNGINLFKPLNRDRCLAPDADTSDTFALERCIEEALNPSVSFPEALPG